MLKGYFVGSASAEIFGQLRFGLLVFADFQTGWSLDLQELYSLWSLNAPEKSLENYNFSWQID